MTSKKKVNWVLPLWAVLAFILAGCASTSNIRPLVIHEYRLVDMPDISTDSLAYTFAEGDEKELLAATHAYKDLRRQYADYNKHALQPFGYSLKDAQGNEYQGTDRSYNIYHGNDLVAADVVFMKPVSVNASGTEFIDFVDMFDGTYVLTRDRFEQLTWTEQKQPYVYVGDQLLSLETISLANQQLLVRVYLDDKVPYESQVFPGRPTYGLTEGPWSYGGHWALILLDGKQNSQGEPESVTRLIVDGQDLNSVNQYEQSFQFAVLDGRPFYFFQKDSKIGISFDGHEFLQGYDEIPHYNCCSPALLNPGISMNMIWFFARRGEDWYYVEAYVPTPENK